MLDMSQAFPVAPPVRKANLRRIALPTEHGSWGFLLEPIVAGMALAFSPAAVLVALAVIGAFLARRPFTVLVMQRQESGRPVNTAAAFLAGYSTLALIGFSGLISLAGPVSLVPFVIAAPVAAYQLYTEITRRGRQLTAEIAGAVIMPSSAAAMVLAGGGTSVQAVSIWLFFIARFIPSILYVRNRLNLEKGKQDHAYVPIVLHLAALVIVILLAVTGHLPLLTVPVFALLLARAGIGLSPYRRRVRAMKIGLWEVIYGAIVLLSLIAGHYAGY